jgi:hypothetical protein
MFEEQKDVDPEIEMLRDQIKSQGQQIERLTGALEMMRAHSEFSKTGFDDLQWGSRKVQRFSVATLAGKSPVEVERAVTNHLAGQLEARPPSQDVNFDYRKRAYATHITEAVRLEGEKVKVPEAQRHVIEKAQRRALGEAAAFARFLKVAPFLLEAEI